MPHVGSSASQTVTAAVYTLQFSVSSWTRAGYGCTATGVLLRDSSPLAGATIYVERWTGSTWEKVAETTTNAQGAYSVTWTVPYDQGCTTQKFRARAPAYGVTSAEKSVAVAYNTRISLSAPSQVTTGVAFTVSGKLERETGSGTWSGLGGKTVKIYYDSTLAATVTTGSDGSYSASITIPTSGTYTLKAAFDGEGIPASATLAVSTIPLPLQVAQLAAAVAPLAALLAAALAG